MAKADMHIECEWQFAECGRDGHRYDDIDIVMALK